MDAHKRIWAWPHFDGWITGDWSANTYHDERTVAYILVSEHDRLKAERDAFHIEMDRLQTKAMGAVDAARAIEADYVRLMAEKDAEISRLREAVVRARNYIHGGMFDRTLPVIRQLDEAMGGETG